jgi:hypothetical protein
MQGSTNGVQRLPIVQRMPGGWGSATVHASAAPAAVRAVHERRRGLTLQALCHV